MRVKSGWGVGMGEERVGGCRVVRVPASESSRAAAQPVHMPLQPEPGRLPARRGPGRVAVLPVAGTPSC